MTHFLFFLIASMFFNPQCSLWNGCKSDWWNVSFLLFKLKTEYTQRQPCYEDYQNAEMTEITVTAVTQQEPQQGNFLVPRLRQQGNYQLFYCTVFRFVYLHVHLLFISRTISGLLKEPELQIQCECPFFFTCLYKSKHGFNWNLALEFWLDIW